VDDCLFCRIVARKEPAEIVAENPETVVFLAADGDPLVVTREHIPSIYRLDPRTGAAVMREASRIADAVKRGLGCDGVSLAQANDAAAGQEVPHFHVRVSPHWATGGRGPRLVLLEERGFVREMIQEALRDPFALSPRRWIAPPSRRVDLIYQINVTLRAIHPPIWRLLQVPGRATLHQLHLVLQAALGWENYHLYQFEWAGVTIAEPDPEVDPLTFPDLNSHQTRLSTIAPREGTTLVYEYDFGDSWKHDLVVEWLLPAEEGVRYPRCLAGQRACPREDCGGTSGYEDLVEALRDPGHERHAELRTWAGQAYDPEAFDLAATNRALRKVRMPRSVGLKPTSIPHDQYSLARRCRPAP
jgi:diadenosine tetraphosphate (Ap4A) HIT family hydrolase